MWFTMIPHPEEFDQVIYLCYHNTKPPISLRSELQRVHQQYSSSKKAVRIVVLTITFGMGYLDVRGGIILF